MRGDEGRVNVRERAGACKGGDMMYSHATHHLYVRRGTYVKDGGGGCMWKGGEGGGGGGGGVYEGGCIRVRDVHVRVIYLVPVKYVPTSVDVAQQG